AHGLTQLLAPLCEAVMIAPDFYRQRTDALRTLPEIAHDLDVPGRRAALGVSLARAAAQAHVTHLLLPTLGLVDPLAASAEPARAAGRDALAALPNESLFAERAAGPHPGLAAGVTADSELRAGTAFVCGAVLGGFDPARDEGGLGVCAVTGVIAGRRAAREAGTASASGAVGR